MGFGRVKKLGIGVVAAATMAGGAALAAPAVAMADAPTIAVEQDGNDVTVTTTDENAGLAVCLPVLVSGETALKALVAYQAGDYGAIADMLVNGGQDVQYGEIASHNAVDIPVVGEYRAFPNPSTTNWTDVNDGVYILVGACANPTLAQIGDIFGAVFSGQSVLGTVLGLVTDDITVRPLIVPNGIGSISPALDFGSLLLKSGDALSALSSDGLLTGLLGAGTGS
ncbi:hypothetical protein [Tomitella gaofuii]|uniref:hypothetical protein n=1 Tax=Tomitella gaofuii TaxID=2760083 RepID=UPI0015FE1373|nr:hypothetical protein [Tomitella gaofuii]